MKRYFIKTNWSEVTVIEYSIIKQILTSEFLDEDQKIEKLIITLSDLTINELNSLKIADYKYVVSKILFVKDSPTEVSISKSITVNNKKFECDIKLENIVTGQYLMLQNILKTDEDFDSKLKKILPIFIRPKGVSWGDYDYDEVQEFLYNNLSIEVAYSLGLFFSSMTNKLLKAIQASLLKETKTKKKIL